MYNLSFDLKSHFPDYSSVFFFQWCIDKFSKKCSCTCVTQKETHPQ